MLSVMTACVRILYLVSLMNYLIICLLQESGTKFGSTKANSENILNNNAKISMKKSTSTTNTAAVTSTKSHGDNKSRRK